MKKLICLLIILFTLNGVGQCLSDDTNRVAVPNTNKDTLYVVVDMYMTFKILWDASEFDGVRPTIIPVPSLLAYIRKD